MHIAAKKQQSKEGVSAKKGSLSAALGKTRRYALYAFFSALAFTCGKSDNIVKDTQPTFQQTLKNAKPHATIAGKTSVELIGIEGRKYTADLSARMDEKGIATMEGATWNHADSHSGTRTYNFYFPNATIMVILDPAAPEPRVIHGPPMGKKQFGMPLAAN